MRVEPSRRTQLLTATLTQLSALFFLLFRPLFPDTVGGRSLPLFLGWGYFVLILYFGRAIKCYCRTHWRTRRKTELGAIGALGVVLTALCAAYALKYAARWQHSLFWIYLLLAAILSLLLLILLLTERKQKAGNE